MHVHQSIWKGGKPLFAGNKYSDLSDDCLYYIGGIIRPCADLERFHQSVDEFVQAASAGLRGAGSARLSARNRSASCRIPYTSNPKAKRVEVRFPDPTANPYLAFRPC